jgi:hypothetical protein
VMVVLIVALIVAVIVVLLELEGACVEATA